MSTVNQSCCGDSVLLRDFIWWQAAITALISGHVVTGYSFLSFHLLVLFSLPFPRISFLQRHQRWRRKVCIAPYIETGSTLQGPLEGPSPNYCQPKCFDQIIIYSHLFLYATFENKCISKVKLHIKKVKLFTLSLCDIGGCGMVCADAALWVSFIESHALSVLLIPLAENEC